MKLDPENLSKRILHSGVVRWTLILLTAIIAGNSIIAAMGGNFELAGQVASLAAALATILLVSLTSQYAERTRELVEQNRKSRKQRKREREKESQREVESLRRALHEEIGKIAYLEDLIEEYEVSKSAVEFSKPSTVYENNASKIGLLSTEEIDPIVEYYTRLDRVDNFRNFQREMDTVVGKGPVQQWFRSTKALQRHVINTISFGYLGSLPSKRREEGVREEIRKLAASQERALNAIEENLESPEE